MEHPRISFWTLKVAKQWQNSFYAIERNIRKSLITPDPRLFDALLIRLQMERDPKVSGLLRNCLLLTKV